MTLTTGIPAVTGPWNDPASPVQDRARALLAEMSLSEKVAQLGSSWPGQEDAGGDVAPMQETFRGARPFDQEIRHGLGHITRAFGTAPIEPETGRRRLAGLQADVMAANRFGIPAIAHEECLTGFTAWQATVYPTALAWAATWNPDLVESMAAAIGADMAALGVHQGLSPVLDVVRDYRWGRVEETMGEDPYLVSATAAGYVRGLQSAGVIATLKHFAGYSASRGARNHAPVSVGSREFTDVVLPPFEYAVLAAGARSVMNSYADVDGVPPAADHELLTGLLRDTWGFTGTVVSDYWAVPFLASMHMVAADVAAAGVMAIEAGLDVELPHTLGFGVHLERAVASGQLDVAVIDRAALRVLTQKVELGLLDPDWMPDGYDTPVDLDSDRNRMIASSMAEQSVVLLSNDRALLPATRPGRIAVIGPTADDSGCLFGCYSFPNHVVAKTPGVDIGVDAPTVLDAIRAEFPDSEVVFEHGCPVVARDRRGIPAAVAAARAADLTVLLVGDRSGMFGEGTSGEGCDVTTLALPGVQDELAHAVLQASDCVVLVVVSGRPYAIGPHAQASAATLQVFFPGETGGAAVAGVLSGRLEPSGRLPVQIPGSVAPQPGTYLAPPLALASDGVSNIDPSPAFAFGHGLAYTDFELDNIAVDRQRIETDEAVRVTISVTNVGERPGVAVPQLYLTDPVASVARPVRRLVGFTRVELAAGTTARLEFTVHADLSAFTGRDRRRRVEPGDLVLTVAHSAADIGEAVQVELVGPTRHVDHRRVMTSTVRLLERGHG